MRISSKRTKFAISVAVAALMALTACSSSGGSSSNGSSGAAGASGDSGGGSGSTLKIGIINDTTGAASSGFKFTEKGVQAYINAVNAEGGVSGHKLEYVMADSTSTPAGALVAAQKLVQKDKVFAVISVTSFFFGAEPYLLKAGMPVIGTGFDGPEWLDRKNTNLFNSVGNYNPTAAYTYLGQAVKKLGGTSCGSIGYSESPSASGSAKAFNKSCVAAGLKSAYNSDISFGDTNVGPIALGMKNKNVDSIETSVQPATSFALAAALKQYKVPLKAVILPIGYGAELLESAPTLQAAQGFYFIVQNAPVETNTPATKVLVKRLTAVGGEIPPSLNEMVPYISLAAFAEGIKAAGSSPTQKSFMDAMRKVKDFDAEGVLAPRKVNFSDYNPAQQCAWIVRLEGKKFIPIEGLSPVCGTQVK